jgi:hypothetical protein
MPVLSSTLRAGGVPTASVRPIRNKPIASTVVTASRESTRRPEREQLFLGGAHSRYARPHFRR